MEVDLVPVVSAAKNLASEQAKTGKTNFEDFDMGETSSAVSHLPATIIATIDEPLNVNLEPQEAVPENLNDRLDLYQQAAVVPDPTLAKIEDTNTENDQGLLEDEIYFEGKDRALPDEGVLSSIIPRIDLLVNVAMPPAVESFLAPTSNQEDEFEESKRAPPVSLSFRNDTFWLFADYVEEDEQDAKVDGDDQQPVASTSKRPIGSHKSGFTVLYEAVEDHSLYYAPMKNLFQRLHEQFPSFDADHMEIRLSITELGIEVQEDNVYASQISLHDLDRIHIGCELPSRMHVTLSEAPRFIYRFNTLAKHVAKFNGTLSPDESHEQLDELDELDEDRAIFDENPDDDDNETAATALEDYAPSFVNEEDPAAAANKEEDELDEEGPPDQEQYQDAEEAELEQDQNQEPELEEYEETNEGDFDADELLDENGEVASANVAGSAVIQEPQAALNGSSEHVEADAETSVDGDQIHSPKRSRDEADPATDIPADASTAQPEAKRLRSQ